MTDGSCTPRKRALLFAEAPVLLANDIRQGECHETIFDADITDERYSVSVIPVFFLKSLEK